MQLGQFGQKVVGLILILYKTSIFGYLANVVTNWSSKFKVLKNDNRFFISSDLSDLTRTLASLSLKFEFVLYLHVYTLSTLLFVRWKAVGPMVLAACQGVHLEARFSLFVLPADSGSSFHRIIILLRIIMYSYYCIFIFIGNHHSLPGRSLGRQIFAFCAARIFPIIIISSYHQIITLSFYHVAISSYPLIIMAL